MNALTLFNDLINDVDFYDPFENFNFVAFPKFNNSPKVNIKNEDNSYKVEVAIPGLNKNDVKVTVKDNILSIEYKKETKEHDSTNNEKYVHQEWSSSEFKNSWNIPENVKVDQIKANIKDGVLTISLPYEKENKKIDNVKQICIE
jgi:HSP20 family protein